MTRSARFGRHFAVCRPLQRGFGTYLLVVVGVYGLQWVLAVVSYFLS